MTVQTETETVAIPVYSASVGRIIFTDSPYSFEFIYSTPEVALKAVRRELRGKGFTTRKATDHSVRTTAGAARLSWDIYSAGEHVGYMSITTGDLDTTRPHVLVHDGGSVAGGAFTDGPTDDDDLAIAVAHIVGAHYIANGDRKLNWADTLTEAQEMNPENGDRFHSVRAHVLEMIQRARPFTEHSYSDGWTVVNHIPDCEFCTDHAIVSAWQNSRDMIGHGHTDTPEMERAIRLDARDFTGANGQKYDEWAGVGRCTRCAGRHGHRDESASYAYGRVDETYSGNAPLFVREAAERVALDTDPGYRSLERLEGTEPSPWRVCVRDLTTGKHVWHSLKGLVGAEEIAQEGLRQIAASLPNYASGELMIVPKDCKHLGFTRDGFYSPGFALMRTRDYRVISYADVHFTAWTEAMRDGNPNGDLALLVYGINTGRNQADSLAQYRERCNSALSNSAQ